ncbi:hypothetical protein [Neptuniibacter sp. QD37_11]|uniref:hypothetical protein n=1 Tax=Neptuniibacter sp. QD37_11 TaxID=3398209 RepID=UPI0039F5B20F
MTDQTISLKHRREITALELVEGGFTIDEGKLFLSLAAKGEEDEQLLSFAVSGGPELTQGKATEFSAISNPINSIAGAHVAASFEAEDVLAKLSIEWPEENQIIVDLKLQCVDVAEEGKSVKKYDIAGKVTLDQVDRKEIWLPSC